MASWVQQILEANPELAALPVAKRARRSLHLRRPDGKILGLFTGGPIHYRDEQDEWQPLDTMPLYDIGRGLWYCPGLNVVITSAGVVQLGDYSQHTRRIGLFRPSTMELLATRDVPLGQREDDALVAERDEWRVERRITATGYRELLTLKVQPDIPQAQVGDFLVLETLVGGVTLPNGWVEGEYAISEHWSPMPTAWDANGEPLTCRRYWRDGVLYTGIPVTELAHAVYPVVIDPDFTGSTADGYITGESNGDYAVARSTAFLHQTTYTYFNCGQNKSGTWYYVYRDFLKFDTSGIGGGQTITQVNLNMTVYVDNSATDFAVQIVKQDWSAQDPIAAGNREAAYDNCLAGAADDNIWRNTAGMATNTNYTSGNLSTAWPDPLGDTYYSLRSSRDKDATEPTGLEQIAIYAAEHATEAYRPYLTILYEAANGGVEVTPDPVTAVAASTAPTVGLGLLSITPAALTAIGATVAPTVTEILTITPAALTAIAASIAPTIVLGGLSITPSALIAIGASIAPTITFGSLSLTPSALTSVAAITAPTVGLGSLSITPSALTTIGASVAPTITLGALSITPSVLIAIGASVAPTITLGSLSLTPSVLTAIGVVTAPTIGLGSLSITPSALAAIAVITAPTVTMGSLSITPSALTGVAASVAPTVTLGALSITPNALTAIAVVVAPSVTVGQFWPSISVTPSVLTAVATIVAPTIALGSLSLTPSALTAIAATVAPTVTEILTITPSAVTAIAVVGQPTVYIPDILTLIMGFLQSKILEILTGGRVPSRVPPDLDGPGWPVALVLAGPGRWERSAYGGNQQLRTWLIRVHVQPVAQDIAGQGHADSQTYLQDIGNLFLDDPTLGDASMNLTVSENQITDGGIGVLEYAQVKYHGFELSVPTKWRYS